jgi:DNA-binding transcriptional regulator YhcF (GntR family)
MTENASLAMLLVNRAAEAAVYEQIADDLRRRISAGELTPGASLPPVRTLASDLGVNLNTVARAYRLLEEEGFVRIRDRGGVQVAAPAVAGEAQRARLSAQLTTLLACMRQAGFTPEELRGACESGIGMRDRASGRGDGGGS